MKIGFDAKWLGVGPPSGRRVWANLIRALPESAGEDELHFFLDRRLTDRSLVDHIPADRRHFVWGGVNQVANLTVVPRAADALGLDVVVYQNFPPPRAMSRHRRVAFIFDAIFASHPEFFTRRERLYFAPLRGLAARADRVCTLSASERGRLATLRFAALERIDVAHLAVDDVFTDETGDRSAAFAEMPGLPANFVLYVGRLNARKNLPRLIAAMQLVTTPDLALVVVGEPDGASAGLDAAPSGRVHFVGGLSDAAVRGLYQRAMMFCFPSLDEGFGLGPLEAMAMGAPVIISDAPALREVCGDSAVVADCRDPQALARAIDTLAGDEGRRRDLARAGRMRAREFSWPATAERLLESARAAVRSGSAPTARR